MNLRFWIVLINILFLLSSCDSINFKSPTTTIPNFDETQVISEETATPTINDIAATATPPINLTHDPPLTTNTPIFTSLVGEEPNKPTIAPTNILIVKPSATQAPLSVQIGSPLAIKNFVYPDLGCNWWGLAGQVMDIEGQPIIDVVVEVGGTLNGQPFFGLAVTGESTAYGPGGYEIKIGDNPVGTDGIFWAIVYDLEGKVISAPTYFPTFDDCNKNLILLNFVQTSSLPNIWAYLPVIFNKSPNR